MHHPSSVRVPQGPGNTPFGVGGSLSTSTNPAANGPDTYPNVSVGSTMNCGTEVSAITEELRLAVEQCQVREY